MQYDINRKANVSTQPDTVLGVIETFKYYPDKGMSFSFDYTTQEKTYRILQNLDKKKTCQDDLL